jgi:hypothetical protein
MHHPIGDCGRRLHQAAGRICPLHIEPAVAKANQEEIHAYVMLIRLPGDLYGRLKATGKWPADQEANHALAEHSRYWHERLSEGRAILAGGMNGDYWDNVALIIFEANSQAEADAMGSR